MPFRVKCPAGHNLMVPDSRAGKAVRCPKCEAIFQVPQRSTPLETSLAPAEASASAEPLPSVDSPPVVIAPSVTATPPLPADANLATTIVQAPTAQPTIEPPPVVAEPPVPPVTVAASTMAPVDLQSAKEIMPSVEPPVLAATPAVPAITQATAPVAAAPAESGAQAPAATMQVFQPLRAAVEIDASTKQWGMQLALGLMVTALFSSAPGIWDCIDYISVADEGFIARWALLLLALGVLQGAFAIYVWQLADWTSLWIVTLLSLAIASGFAMMLGVIFVAGQESQLVTALQLEDRLIGNKAHLWCLCMVAVYTVVAFFAGRACSQWHRREQLLESLAS